MRHGKKIHKMSRPAEHRRATLNNLARALITYKQIQTTDSKAKALKPYIDKLISAASQNTLQARRQVAQSLPDKEAFKELFNVIVPRLEGRTSGFSRIVKYKARKGDGAPLSIVQLILEKEESEKGKRKGKKKAKAKTKPPKEAKAPREEEKEEVPEESAEEPETPEVEASEDIPEEEIIEEAPENEEGQETPQMEEEDKKE
jgi:large subunit ribosomal protein L17